MIPSYFIGKTLETVLISNFDSETGKISCTVDLNPGPESDSISMWGVWQWRQRGEDPAWLLTPGFPHLHDTINEAAGDVQRLRDMIAEYKERTANHPTAKQMRVRFCVKLVSVFE